MKEPEMDARGILNRIEQNRKENNSFVRENAHKLLEKSCNIIGKDVFFPWHTHLCCYVIDDHSDGNVNGDGQRQSPAINKGYYNTDDDIEQKLHKMTDRLGQTIPYLLHVTIVNEITLHCIELN